MLVERQANVEHRAKVAHEYILMYVAVPNRMLFCHLV